MAGWLAIGPWAMAASNAQTDRPGEARLLPSVWAQSFLQSPFSLGFVLCAQSSTEKTWGTFPATRGQPLLGQLRWHPCKDCGLCSECPQWFMYGVGQEYSGLLLIWPPCSPFLSPSRLWSSCLPVGSLYSSSLKSPLGTQGPGFQPWARPG